MEHASKVRTCLWFEKGGHEAAQEYVALVPDSRIEAVRENGQPDDPMIVELSDEFRGRLAETVRPPRA